MSPAVEAEGSGLDAGNLDRFTLRGVFVPAPAGLGQRLPFGRCLIAVRATGFNHFVLFLFEEVLQRTLDVALEIVEMPIGAIAADAEAIAMLVYSGALKPPVQRPWELYDDVVVALH
jgi:hypothetical protein